MFLLPGLILLLLIRLIDDVRVAMRRPGPGGFFRTGMFRACMVLLLLMVVPPVVVNSGLLDGLAQPDARRLLWVSGGVSLAISVFWYRYLAWLDAFEPEQRGQSLRVFLFACGTTFLVWPITGLIHTWTGAQLNGGLWNDWWYSFLVIGGVEETVKLLPVLWVFHRTEWVNEPFDLLFYGCVSALGFAFVENTMYLADTELHAMAGRALMASVSHMFNTSVICYGLVIARYHGRERWWHLPALWALASASHGFYDLWLLAPGRPEILTILFYFGTMQLWVIMKNNLINISPHYRSELFLGNSAGRYRIFNGLLTIFMGTYIIIAARSNVAEAQDFLYEGGLFLCATLSFLSISFSSYVLVRGYLAPLRLSYNPLRWILPRMQWGADLSRRRVELTAARRGRNDRSSDVLAPYLPAKAVVLERAALGTDTEWYLLRPDTAILLHGHRYDLFLVKLHEDHEDLPERAHALLFLRGIKGDAPVDSAVYTRTMVSVPLRVLVREPLQFAV